MLLSGALGQTPPSLRVVGIEHLSGGQLKLTFQDSRTNLQNYVLSSRLDLSPGATNYLDLEARIVALGGGFFETVIPIPPASPTFYRVAGFGGPDNDGDGLSDALENLLGTSTGTFDTDGDGFGDGVELVHGANPLDSQSVPPINLANFTTTTSTAREGDGNLALRVTFSRPFSGTLNYQISDMSTAVAGDDFAPLSGSVVAMGTNAVIPITLLDDTNMEPTKLLSVDLLAVPGASYQVGGASRQTVLLYDNDTHWSGLMRTEDSTELGFRLRLLRLGGTVAGAALVSELSTNRSQGVGSIPLGVWPVQATLTANGFYAISDPIPMGSSLLTGDVPIQRVLTFTATAGTTNQLVRSNAFIGQFTDTLSSSAAGMAWVSGSATGIVILIEDIPESPPAPPPSEGALRGLHAAKVKGGGQ